MRALKALPCIAVLVGCLLITTTMVVSQEPPTPEHESVAVLKSQVELMRKNNEQLFTMMWSVLGVTVTLLAVVIGLGWFTNFRIYKREVEELKRELLKDRDDELKAAVGKMRSEVRETVSSSVSSSLKDIKTLQYKLLEIDAENWKTQGVYANALTSYGRMIPLSLDVYSEHMIGGLLDDMLELVKDEKHRHYADTDAEILEALNKVPAKFDTAVSALKDAMKAAASR